MYIPTEIAPKNIKCHAVKPLNGQRIITVIKTTIQKVRSFLRLGTRETGKRLLLKGIIFLPPYDKVPLVQSKRRLPRSAPTA